MTEVTVPYGDTSCGITKSISVLCDTAANSLAKSARNWHRMASDAEREIELKSKIEISRETGHGLNEIRSHNDRIKELQNVADLAISNREAAFDAADALLEIGKILRDIKIEN